MNLTTTILLIEDSNTVRGFLRRIFQSAMPEATIIEAVEGRQALQAMTRCKADLIISDLQMPGMDGRSFIAKLRSNSLLKKKNVLVLSSDNIDDLLELYRDDKGIAFLNKPSTSADIVSAARALLATSSTSFSTCQ